MNDGLNFMMGGSLLNAGGSIYGGLMAIRQSKYAEDVAKWQAKYTDALTELEAAKIDLETGKILSAQKAQTAASGIRTDVGAPLEVAAETEIMADIDKQILRMSGGIEALRIRNQGNLARSQGYGTGSAMFMRAGWSLLDTAIKLDQRSGLLGATKEPSYPRNFRSFG